MIVRIYDFLSAEKPKFSENLVGIVSDVTKFKYTRRAYDIGSFEMEVPTHANDAEYIQPDRMLIVGEKLSETYISGDPTRRIVNGTFLYVTEVDKNDQTITVTGYDLKYLFASRVTLFPAEEQNKGTYGYYVVSGTTFSCISNLINYNIINATDSDRQIFGMSAITMPTTQVDAGLTGIQDDRYMTRLEPLSTAIFNLLKNCKTHFYDVRLLIDDNADDADNYNPHLESSEDKPTIIIDESRYNIKSYTRKDGTSAYKNAIYAVSGTGDDVVVKCVKREGDTASGIKRKEVVLDVDTDSVSEIDRYAIKAAEDYNISDDFEIEPLFDDDDAEPTLAQKVLIRIDGVDYETVITEITDEYSDGKHTQSYVCGDKKLKVLNVLNKATAGNTQKIINNKISVGKIENAIGDLIVSSPKVELLFDNQTLENSGTGNNTIESVGTDAILYGTGKENYCYSPTNHSAIRISSISFDSFTIMCWFKAQKDGLSPYSQYRRLFAWANSSGKLCDVEFSPQKTGKIHAVCDADHIVETNKAYNDGDWHLAIYRKLGGNVIVDIDNERLSFINKLADIKNGVVYISDEDYSFNGYIDSFAIFDKYLSDSEINSYKNGSKYRLSYNDLSDKPKINGVIITDDKLPDDLGLAAKEHNHIVSDIADMPDWAKQPAKPTYTASEVGAAAEQHKHSTADITDFPAIPKKVSELQNDSGYISEETDPTVPAWAKSDTKPTYTASEVGAAEAVHTHAQSDITGLASALDGKANTSHTHTKSDITDFPTSMKNPNALTVQFNGTTNQTYDGSVAKTVNITPAGIGAATAEDITTAIDAVEIGARNIATGTASMTVGAINSALWSNGQWRYSGTGSIATIDITDSPVPSISKGIRVTSTQAQKQIGIVQDKIPLNSNNIYTLSCWVRGSAASGLKCKLQPFYASSTDTGGALEINITDQWQYVSFTTVRSPQNTAEYSAACVYLISSAIGDTMDICGVKLERGNKATDWCPAPEDKADKGHTHSDYLPLTGGRLTGKLEFYGSNTAWSYKNIKSTFEKGTIPKETQFWDFNFMDKNGGDTHANRIGYVESTVGTTGLSAINIIAMQNVKDSTKTARLTIGMDTKGNEYMRLGSSTIGDSETPVYINAGQVTPTDYKFSDFMLASGKGAISEEHSFWSGTSSHTFNYVTGRNRAFIIAWMDDAKSTYMGFNLIYAATTVNTTSAVRLAYNGTVSMSYNIANGNITIGSTGNGASGYACRCAVIWFTV